MVWIPMIWLTSVINILLYSRLNPLITVHQISSDLPLSWLDTPFLLPLPQNNPKLTPPGPNFGLVIIPSDVNLHGEDVDMITPQDTSFTMYTLQSGLGIMGDIYGTQKLEVQSLAIQPVKSTKLLSPKNFISSSGSESEEEWIPYQSNWKVDFSPVAKTVLLAPAILEPLTRQKTQRIRKEVLDKASFDTRQFETMYSQFFVVLIAGLAGNIQTCSLWKLML
jgi:hypothetical protein